jgi:DNA-binding CsgD family transcriptional regulator
MKVTNVDLRDRQMLELLSKGASTDAIARKMGYSPGTVRVYLHNLYRKLGVRNRTEAVIRHLNEARATAERPAEARVAMPTPALSSAAADSFGGTALRDGLFCALGVMESFLGPYSRVWEVGQRLKGAAIDEAALARRTGTRFLWRALLNEDWSAGKRRYDEGAAERLDGGADGQLLACLLLIGGFSSAAEHVLGQLLGRRRSASGAGEREGKLLRALRDGLAGEDEAPIAALHALAEATPASPLKQTAMVVLYYAYKARKDLERARATANAIWAEAEAARRQLEAVGVRPLDRDAVLPDSGRTAARRKAADREKVAAVR